MLDRKCEKSILALGGVLVLIVFLASFASAADVAYVYHSERKIDSNVVEIFEEMDLEVEYVLDKELPIDSNDYDLVFIGNEKISNSNKMPVSTMPLVVMNRDYGALFGLTDRGGVSRIASSRPVSVMYDGEEIDVYDTNGRRKTLSYYYLSDRSKGDAFVDMVSMKKNSGNKLGDAVSCAATGEKLENGKKLKANICFFGLVDSEYWTEDAKEIFEECVAFALSEELAACDSDSDCDDGNSATDDSCIYPGTPAAMCQNSPIGGTCEENIDCGTDGYVGENFCHGGNIMKKYRVYACSAGSCSHADENRLIETCTQGCSAGACVSASGFVHNVALVNVTNAVGPVRIQNVDGDDVSSEEALICNEKYKVIIRAKNLGNFTENITFTGGTTGLEIEHGAVESLEPGKTSDRTKTVNFTLPAGNYELNFHALISGVDSNPLDNIVKRDIQVTCGSTATCTQSSDCGADGYIGINFCSGGNVVRTYKTFTCTSGSCSSVNEDRLIETCANGCSGGVCGGTSGLVHDISLVNVTNTVGLIRLQYSNGSDVPAGRSVTCNQKYKVIVRLKNVGNFTESATFEGSIGPLQLEFSDVEDLEAGKTSDRTKTLNFTLGSGTYDLGVQANLEGFTDPTPANNAAHRSVVVNC